MSIALIVAVANNGVIGRGGELPWRLSSDLKRFKQITMGHALVVGRKTYESIGRPLPGRESFVISRQAGFAPPGVHVAASLPEALALASGHEQIFIIGGGEIFREAAPLADRLYLTRVEGDVEGDVYFELPDLAGWRLLERSAHPSDERNSHPTKFEIYERGDGKESPP